MELKVKLFANQTITYASQFPLGLWGFPFSASMEYLWTFSLSMKHLPTSKYSAFCNIFLIWMLNVFVLCRLEELRIDDNLLTALPNTLKLLRNLKSISVSNNKITRLPDFMIAMRFHNGMVSCNFYLDWNYVNNLL